MINLWLGPFFILNTWLNTHLWFITIRFKYVCDNKKLPWMFLFIVFTVFSWIIGLGSLLKVFIVWKFSNEFLSRVDFIGLDYILIDFLISVVEEFWLHLVGLMLIVDGLSGIYLKGK
jgi:uncharacterized Tic20 family protein